MLESVLGQRWQSWRTVQLINSYEHSVCSEEQGIMCANAEQDVPDSSDNAPEP